MNVTKLHNVTKQNSYMGQIGAGSCNLVTKLQFCLFLHSDINIAINVTKLLNMTVTSE